MVFQIEEEEMEDEEKKGIKSNNNNHSQMDTYMDMYTLYNRFAMFNRI